MAKVNKLDLALDEYKGGKSTLCPGCGHDAISSVIMKAAWENSITPDGIAKMSGIGCSSKTPAYFLRQSHGFNTAHGRMPSVTTGANMANKDLNFLAVSGDGDTASIGIGQFIHAIRRNLNMLYIVENNGVYGLTKGQYSATAEEGSQKRKSVPNELKQIDLCAMAINLGCSFVARSFSGSRKQLTALIRAGMSHRGMAVIDVISPCVTFNNNEESYKSLQYVKNNNEELHGLDYIPHFNPIEEVEIPSGGYKEVKLHDGSYLRLETISEEHDVGDRMMALDAIHNADVKDKHVTGLLYFQEGIPTLDETENLVDTPLAELSEDMLRPSKETLDDLLTGFRA
ncbi:MAG: 2-oxoglutarate ferredoxin oxidoreductase subunit beta [Marine Group III euryarchaeote CG-Epi1]|uniref:2-oxoglutarate ferredoxin oxidoreductase subunit beta n=1 Tax=Marine Group III euryarchaeote CG-Epi1 TaxID=1888995 RepID=A0A1J5TXE0_9ARCH|nr:MAG: 2-oxoglutarate ferredoxin oxidoreductase subunit beta [Marine Group III euryarchaeote CG-Epi1]